MKSGAVRWTNGSVLAFAKGEDPVGKIQRKAREVVINAIDSGWTGPPYDPILLADILKTPVVPRDDIRDARTIPHGQKGSIIEFNPTAPRWRVRFSIAHEIAHTFFQDCSDQVRNRIAHTLAKGDEWQLEFLCNIAAAEMIMPIGSLVDLPTDSIGIEHLMSLKQRYDVSTEALLMRVAKITELPCAVFFATPIESGPRANWYRLDHIVSSRSFSSKLTGGTYIFPHSILSHCQSIGFTASGTEKWSSDVDKYEIECVGIPPLPGNNYPRVAGILKPTTQRGRLVANNIAYVRGNALTPRGDGSRIIAHIVNDQSVLWGGQSFAALLRRKWPMAQDDFREWVLKSRSEFSLGSIRQVSVGEGVTVVSMVAQRGYGPSPTPRIRYSALQSCLSKLATTATDLGASIHMPRIGAGNAGGSWKLIEEMIQASICNVGLAATVYSLPDRNASVAPDLFLAERHQ
jgi:O-acetyl-ADP-ribose deacetylase (regulator of RNase III)